MVALSVLVFEPPHSPPAVQLVTQVLLLAVSQESQPFWPGVHLVGSGGVTPQGAQCPAPIAQKPFEAQSDDDAHVSLQVRLRREVDELEKQRILAALAQCDGNQTRAAELLGVSRRTLINRIVEFDLPRPRKRGEAGRLSATLEAGVGWAPVEFPSTGRGGKLPPRVTRKSLAEFRPDSERVAQRSKIQGIESPWRARRRSSQRTIFGVSSPAVVARQRPATTSTA